MNLVQNNSFEILNNSQYTNFMRSYIQKKLNQIILKENKNIFDMNIVVFL